MTIFLEKFTTFYGMEVDLNLISKIVLTLGEIKKKYPLVINIVLEKGKIENVL